RDVDRHEPAGILAVAGAVRTQRLAIGERILAVGVALAIGGSGVVDIAAEIDFCGTRRAEGLAHLRRRRVATRGHREIFSVAAAHAKGGSGAGDARRWRRCALL